jgi:acyl-coenzyme A synthetase/AMP-(fatty) acid ligase
VIEAVLQEHPSVQLACVIGVPSDLTCLAKALVVLNEGKEATAEELIQLVASKLPDNNHLHGGVQFVQHLPESKGRKLDRTAIFKLYGNA